jgi:hypothetical protein
VLRAALNGRHSGLAERLRATPDLYLA